LFDFFSNENSGAWTPITTILDPGIFMQART